MLFKAPMSTYDLILHTWSWQLPAVTVDGLFGLGAATLLRLRLPVYMLHRLGASPYSTRHLRPHLPLHKSGMNVLQLLQIQGAGGLDGNALM